MNIIMNNFIIAQILGILLIILCIVPPQMKTKRGLLFVAIFFALLNLSQFAVLGKWTGVTTASVALLRHIVFYIYSLKDKKSPLWMLIVIIALQIGGVAWTWQGWYCAFALLTIFNAYGEWQKNVQITRVGLMCANFGVGVYSIIAGAYANVIKESIMFCSAAIALWRFRKIKEQKSV